jgi:hypothetical protein
MKRNPEMHLNAKSIKVGIHKYPGGCPLEMGYTPG